MPAAAMATASSLMKTRPSCEPAEVQRGRPERPIQGAPAAGGRARQSSSSTAQDSPSRTFRRRTEGSHGQGCDRHVARDPEHCLGSVPARDFPTRIIRVSGSSGVSTPTVKPAPTLKEGGLYR